MSLYYINPDILLENVVYIFSHSEFEDFRYIKCDCGCGSLVEVDDFYVKVQQYIDDLNEIELENDEKITILFSDDEEWDLLNLRWVPSDCECSSSCEIYLSDDEFYGKVVPEFIEIIRGIREAKI